MPSYNLFASRMHFFPRDILTASVVIMLNTKFGILVRYLTLINFDSKLILYFYMLPFFLVYFLCII